MSTSREQFAGGTECASVMRSLAQAVRPSDTCIADPVDFRRSDYLRPTATTRLTHFYTLSFLIDFPSLIATDRLLSNIEQTKIRAKETINQTTLEYRPASYVNCGTLRIAKTGVIK